MHWKNRRRGKCFPRRRYPRPQATPRPPVQAQVGIGSAVRAAGCEGKSPRNAGAGGHRGIRRYEVETTELVGVPSPKRKPHGERSPRLLSFASPPFCHRSNKQAHPHNFESNRRGVLGGLQYRGKAVRARSRDPRL